MGKSIDIERKSFEKNDTKKLTDLRNGKKTMRMKWVHKTKLNEKGEVENHKPHLVSKWHMQKYGVDYKEVFFQVVRLDTIKLVLSFAMYNSWCIYHLEVKSTFLHGDLWDHLHIVQPTSYV